MPIYYEIDPSKKSCCDDDDFVVGGSVVVAAFVCGQCVKLPVTWVYIVWAWHNVRLHRVRDLGRGQCLCAVGKYGALAVAAEVVSPQRAKSYLYNGDYTRPAQWAVGYLWVWVDPAAAAAESRPNSAYMVPESMPDGMANHFVDI